MSENRINFSQRATVKGMGHHNSCHFMTKKAYEYISIN